MRRMRVVRVVLGLAFGILLAGAAFAQEAPAAGAPAPAAGAAEEAKAAIRPNSLYPGSWSLQFQITGEIGLKPFNGMIVSVKRHFSERSALRLGVRLDFDWNSNATSALTEVADTVYDWQDLTEERDYQQFMIDLSYLRYVKPGSYVNFFWGAGPLVGFSRSTRTAERTRGENISSTVDEYMRSWSIGALGLVGVEWFLSKSFSFHAEYRASFAYSSSVAEQNALEVHPPNSQNYHSENEGDRWDFQSMSVILGLSVYF